MSKGITVQIIDDTVKVDVIILVRYGCNIVNVAREVQNSVGEVVQAVTGIEKAEIEQLLDRIEQGTAQIETDNNLDEENYRQRNCGSAELLCKYKRKRCGRAAQ